MTKCKDERIGVGGNPGQPSFKIPLSSIKHILKILRSVFLLPDAPLPKITPIELSIGAKLRPGVSRTDTAARVITQKGANGMDTGAAEDGSENISNKKDRIMVEEIMREFQTRGKTEIGLGIGELRVVAPDGTVSTNIEEIKFHGIIR